MKKERNKKKVKKRGQMRKKAVALTVSMSMALSSLPTAVLAEDSEPQTSEEKAALMRALEASATPENQLLTGPNARTARLLSNASSYASINSYTIGGKNGEPYRVTINQNGQIGIYKLVNGSYSQQQYYSGNSNGTSVYLNGTVYATYYVSLFSKYINQTVERLNVTSQTLESGGRAVVTTYEPSSGGPHFKLIQRVEYPINSNMVRRSFTIENTGTSSLNGLRLIHGGDTYFAGDDYGYCYYNSLNRMAYVKRDSTTGIMAISGDADSPADQFYCGYYMDGGKQAASGNLQNVGSMDGSNRKVDASYYLQWNHDSLASGATWKVGISERMTEPGEVQIINPGPVETTDDSQVSQRFEVVNTTDKPQTVIVDVSSENGYPTVIRPGDNIEPSGNSAEVTIPAGGSVTIVVDSEVPPGVVTEGGGSVTDTITVTAKPSTGTGETSQSTNTETVITPSFPTISRVAVLAKDRSTLKAKVMFKNLSGPRDVTLEILDNQGHSLQVPWVQTVKNPDSGEAMREQEFTFDQLSSRLIAGQTYYLKATVEGIGASNDAASFQMNGEDIVAVSDITIDPATVTLKQGSEKQLSATISPSNATNQALQWYSDNDVVRVDANGKVTVVNTVPAKTDVTITAIAQDRSGVKGQCTVTVMPKPQRIQLSQDTVTIEEGETLDLTATLMPDGYQAGEDSIAWTLSGDQQNISLSQTPTIAGNQVTNSITGLKSTDGKYVTITAKSTGGATEPNGTGGVKDTATCKVRVVKKRPTGIQIAEGTSVEIDRGTEKALHVLPNQGAELMDGDVTWTANGSDKVAISDLSSVTPTVTATGVTGSVVTLTVTVNGTSIKQDVSVVITSATTGLTITGPATADKGQSVPLDIAFAPDDATDRAVDWGIVKGAATIDANGMLKVNDDAVAESEIQVQATLKKNPQIKSNIFTLQVTSPTTAIAIDGPNEAAKGKTTELSIDFTPVDATDRQVQWSVTEGAATIDRNGAVTVDADAVAGSKIKVKAVLVKNGSAVDSISAEKELTVISPTIGIAIEGPETMAKGESTDLIIAFNPSDATDRTLRWSLTDGTDIATIDQSGKLQINQDAPADRVVTVKAELLNADGAATDISANKTIVVKSVVLGYTLKTEAGPVEKKDYYNVPVTVTPVKAATDPASYDYYIDGVLQNEKVFATDGKYKVNFYGVDQSNGATTDTSSITFTVDQTKPVIGQITAEKTNVDLNMARLSNSLIASNKQVKLTIEASDATSGIAKVQAQLVAKGGTVRDDGWTDVLLQGGKYTETVTHEFEGNLYVRAYDKAGNESAVAVSDDILLTTQKPAAPGFAMTTEGGTAYEEKTWTNQTVKVEPTSVISDGIISYSLNGKDESQWQVYSGTPIEINASGKAILYARVTDAAGNVSDVSETAIWIDKEPITVVPTTHFDASADYYENQDVIASANLESAYSPRVLQYQVGNSAWTDVNGTTATASTAVADGAMETETVSFRVRNEAGGVADNPLEVAVKVDRRKLNAPIVSASAGGLDYTGDWTKENVTLEAQPANGANTMEYRTSATGTWQPYGSSVVVPGTDHMATETVIYFREKMSDTGKLSPEEAFRVRIDRTAPTISDRTKLQREADGTTTLIASAADTGSGMGTLSYQVGGTTAVDMNYDPVGGYYTATNFQGNGTITLIGTDLAGNAARTSVTLYSDTEAPNLPQISIGAPNGENGWYTQIPEIKITSQGDNPGGSGVKDIQYQLDGGTWVTATSTSVAGEIETTVPMNAVTDGIHTVSARVIDQAGNASESKTETMKIDTQKPAEPTMVAELGYSNPYLQQAKVRLMDHGDGANGSGVEKIQYRLQGESAFTDGNEVVIAPGQGDFDPATNLYETELTYQVIDQAGNVSEPKTETISLEMSPINMSSIVLSSTAEDWTDAPSVTVSLDRTKLEKIDEITKYEASVGGGDYVEMVPEAFTDPEGNSDTLKITEVTGEGITEVRIRLTYQNGSEVISGIKQVKIDRTAPEISVSLGGVKWKKDGSVDVTVSAVDPLSGVESITAADGTAPVRKTDQSAVFTVDENGTYSYLVTDHAGNQVQQDVIVDIFDKEAPAAPTTAFDQSHWYYGETSFTIAFQQDDGSPVILQRSEDNETWRTFDGKETAAFGQTIYYRTMDGVGNLSAPLTVNVQIDGSLKPLVDQYQALEQKYQSTAEKDQMTTDDLNSIEELKGVLEGLSETQKGRLDGEITTGIENLITMKENVEKVITEIKNLTPPAEVTSEQLEAYKVEVDQARKNYNALDPQGQNIVNTAESGEVLKKLEQAEIKKEMNNAQTSDLKPGTVTSDDKDAITDAIKKIEDLMGNATLAQQEELKKEKDRLEALQQAIQDTENKLTTLEQAIKDKLPGIGVDDQGKVTGIPGNVTTEDLAAIEKVIEDIEKVLSEQTSNLTKEETSALEGNRDALTELKDQLKQWNDTITEVKDAPILTKNPNDVTYEDLTPVEEVQKKIDEMKTNPLFENNLTEEQRKAIEDAEKTLAAQKEKILADAAGTIIGVLQYSDQDGNLVEKDNAGNPVGPEGNAWLIKPLVITYSGTAPIQTKAFSYQINNGDPIVVPQNDAGDYKFTLEKDGEFSLMMNLVDGSDHALTSAPVQIKLDQTPPTAAHVVENEEVWTGIGGQKKVIISAKDNTSGVSSITFHNETKTLQPGVNDVLLDFYIAKNGHYTYTVKDQAGNTAIGQFDIQKFDLVTPKVPTTLFVPDRWYYEDQTVRIDTVQDDGSEISFEFSRDGKNWTAMETKSGQDGVLYGEKTISSTSTCYFRTIDGAGNTSTPLQLEVQIDKGLKSLVDRYTTLQEKKTNNTLVPADLNEIKNLHSAYQNLSETQKSHLNEIGSEIEALGSWAKEIEDAIHQITQLPSPDKITSKDKEAVEQAREAYDKLDAQGKDMVDKSGSTPGELLTKLELAEVQVEISDSGTGDLTPDKVTVDDAGKIADALEKVEGLLKDPTLSETKKQELTTEKDRLEELQQSIQKVENDLNEIKDAIGALPGISVDDKGKLEHLPGTVTTEETAALDETIGKIDTLRQPENSKNLTAEQKEVLKDNQKALETLKQDLQVLEQKAQDILANPLLSKEEKDYQDLPEIGTLLEKIENLDNQPTGDSKLTSDNLTRDNSETGTVGTKTKIDEAKKELQEAQNAILEKALANLELKSEALNRKLKNETANTDDLPAIEAALKDVEDLRKFPLTDDQKGRLSVVEYVLNEVKAFAKTHRPNTGGGGGGSSSGGGITAPAPNTNKVEDKIKDLSDLIPVTQVTKDNMGEVQKKLDEIKTLYQGLTEGQKKLVTNYDKVAAYEKAIEALRTPSVPAVPEKTSLLKENAAEIPYIQGMENGSFHPESPVTKEEIAAMIYRLINPENVEAAYPYKDKNTWAKKEITELTKLGILTGKPDGSFGVKDQLTRGEFAVILARLMQLDLEPAEKASFPDAQGRWMEAAVAAVVKAGYMKGYQDGTFGTDHYITRVETVVAINRAIGKKPDNSTPSKFKDVPEDYWAYGDIMAAASPKK